MAEPGKPKEAGQHRPSQSTYGRISRKDVTGVILAGGASRRFGANKALAELAGMPLILHIAQVLETIFPQRLLITNTPERYGFLGWPMAADIFTNAGPLAGIHSGLTHTTTPYIFVTGCDMPFINAALIRYLCTLATGQDVVLPVPAARPEPLFALYARTALPHIEKCLMKGDYKIFKSLAGLKTREVPEAEILAVAKNLSTFHNINFPADLPGSAATEFSPQPLGLAAAQKLIVRLAPLSGTETVGLADSRNRIPSAPVRAENGIPLFSHSTMDGFAVRCADLETASRQNPVSLPVVGEIAAGCTEFHRLNAGTAVRIMTGGVIPPASDLVIPFEKCRETAQAIVVDQKFSKGRHIRKSGSDFAKHRILIQAGEKIRPDHLPTLAAGGNLEVIVHRIPTAAILCTGSELVRPQGQPVAGKIISGNHFMLKSLFEKEGAMVHDLGIVADDCDTIMARLSPENLGHANLVITTGGMGPGKYDLMHEVFRRLDITPLYRNLAVRPGRATMLGIKDSVLYFALPGPPPAVRILFNELVRPALGKMQGLRKNLPESWRVRLNETIEVKRKGMLNLKGGVLKFQDDSLTVRPTGRNEPSDCVILLPAHRRTFKAGDMVAVHLVG